MLIVWFLVKKNNVFGYYKSPWKSAPCFFCFARRKIWNAACILGKCKPHFQKCKSLFTIILAISHLVSFQLDLFDVWKTGFRRWNLVYICILLLWEGVYIAYLYRLNGKMSGVAMTKWKLDSLLWIKLIILILNDINQGLYPIPQILYYSCHYEHKNILL